MSRMSELAAEDEQENLSGALDAEERAWREHYDNETLRVREVMPQPLSVANTNGKGNYNDN